METVCDAVKQRFSSSATSKAIRTGSPAARAETRTGTRSMRVRSNSFAPTWLCDRQTAVRTCSVANVAAASHSPKRRSTISSAATRPQQGSRPSSGMCTCSGTRSACTWRTPGGTSRTCSGGSANVISRARRSTSKSCRAGSRLPNRAVLPRRHRSTKRKPTQGSPLHRRTAA